jgi:hypothetical protein
MSFLESSRHAGTTDRRDSERTNTCANTTDGQTQAADSFRTELLTANLDRRAREQSAAEMAVNPGQVHEFGTTIVSYKDAQIDNHLAFSQARNLRINDIPNDCRVSGWKDTVGYYFYFTDGRDGKKHHYIPATCQFIQAVQENGQRATISVAELKQQIDKAMKPKPATV